MFFFVVVAVSIVVRNLLKLTVQTFFSISALSPLAGVLSQAMRLGWGVQR